MLSPPYTFVGAVISTVGWPCKQACRCFLSQHFRHGTAQGDVEADAVLFHTLADLCVHGSQYSGAKNCDGFV